jgi:hypothetical protein
MSDDSQRNSAVNAAATTNIHHVNLQDISKSRAAVGAVTTVPFSLLTHALRVVRGEISAQEAVFKKNRRIGKS